ncbi:MAG TPA: ABC transporter permease [Steroidobacteraceae bacterium]|jgi:putative ABC transport system permease protein|nr:ABC transporter permease [Steroidobacteraceae bacterium]
MFGYYLGLALRSLRRNPVLTALMIIAIAVGIGASMTMLTIFRAASGNPIPQKSSQLFVPQIDNFGPQPNSLPQNQDRLPPDLTYTDALALMRSHRAVRQAAMYATSLSIIPPDPDQIPIQVNARATYGDFFPMFQVPFEYGGPWSGAEDDAHAAVVVLTRALNDRLFGGVNSIGRTLTINDQPYRVIGVAGDWQPSPRFYDLGQDRYSGVDQLFLPFTRAIEQQMQTAENFNCDAHGPGQGWDGILHSNCIWIEFWAELPTGRDATGYRTFLHNYAADQRQNGRFHWPPHVALRDVAQWLAYNHVVPPTVSTLTSISFAILVVCLLNATGLMLAKFMARAGGVGVRRALGANRPAIFAQCLVEAGVIGLAGGIIGVGLTKLGLVSSRPVLPEDFAVLTRLRGSDVLIAVAVAILAALLAGLYPTWRASQVEPARQLKAQ